MSRVSDVSAAKEIQCEMNLTARALESAKRIVSKEKAATQHARVAAELAKREQLKLRNKAAVMEEQFREAGSQLAREISRQRSQFQSELLAIEALSTEENATAVRNLEELRMQRDALLKEKEVRRVPVWQVGERRRPRPTSGCCEGANDKAPEKWSPRTLPEICVFQVECAEASLVIWDSMGHTCYPCLLRTERAATS